MKEMTAQDYLEWLMVGTEAEAIERMEAGGEQDPVYTIAHN